MKKDWKWFLTIFLPKLPIFILFLPVVILMRCLRPILWIQLFPIDYRIGHTAAEPDTYLLEKKFEAQPSRAKIIFFPLRPTKINQQLVKMWSRVLPVSTCGYWVDWVNMEIPGGKAHQYQLRPQLTRDINHLTYRNPPPVAFTPREEEQGEALLRSMGIPKGAPFVCIHGRDSAFLDHHVPGADWAYHNYRDFSIGNFALAAQELVRRGYYVIRIGRLVKEKFPITDTKVIDYANSHFRSDFADIYLIAKCQFFVGQSGIESVARLFRKPIVYTNFIPIGYLHTWSSSFLSIVKLLKNKKENRLLSFKEMLHPDIRHAYDTKEFESRGLEVIENSPEEVCDAVVEMEERLKLQWKTTDEQEELQRQFWKGFPFDTGIHGENKSRVGSLFLEKYRFLMTEMMSNPIER